jgi:hypothetical protein
MQSSRRNAGEEMSDDSLIFQPKYPPQLLKEMQKYWDEIPKFEESAFDDLKGEHDYVPFGPIPRWIKCSEKLPNAFEFVLGWSINTGPMIVFYNSEYRDWSNQDNKKKDNITHWMPLPEPPNE